MSKALFRLQFPVLGKALIDAGVLKDAGGAELWPSVLYECVTADYTPATTTCWSTQSKAPDWTNTIEVKVVYEHPLKQLIVR